MLGRVQLGGHFGGNGADGDADDIVKQVHLGHLLVAHQLGEKKHGHKACKGREGNAKQIHKKIPP